MTDRSPDMTWRTLLQSFSEVWSDLNARRRIIVIGATMAMFLAVLFVTRSAAQRDMALLFGGLEPSAAGDVITSLDQRGIVYEVRGGAIYVNTAQRDSLRMALAGEGLPATGAQGYELLDGLSGFGTTSQMFDAAYWRAREGELARTILAAPHIRQARVHISTPTSRPFERAQAPTAAVTVSTTTGTLSSQQIKALQYLVGSAVHGLSPSDVAVIDDAGGLISEAGETPRAGLSDERAEVLRQRAERLLAARVGAGNAVVEVTVDTVNESEQIMERIVDPDSRIAISTDVTETEASSQDSRNGDVTVASNLPDGDAAGGGGSASNNNSETRALTNYEVSQTERQIVKEAGAVKRLTVAVLVNDLQTVADDGSTQNTPRSEDELAALQELVSSAVGLDESRGDVITLRSMSFEAIGDTGTFGEPAGLVSTSLNLMQLIQIAVAAIVALVLGLFVVRPIMAGGSGGSSGSLPPPDDFDFPGGAEPAMAMMDTDAMFGNDQPLLGGGSEPADAVSRLREMIAERESETVQILQDWMEEPEQNEGG